MKKVLMVLADGFEDTEALATRDILLRGGVIVTTISIKQDPLVISQYKMVTRTDETIYKVNYEDYDGLILPGGGKGTENLKKSPELKDIIIKFASEHKLLAAICAAPSVFGIYGLLKNKNFTCYTGCEEGYPGNYTDSDIEIDDNFITARSMYYSQDFGLEIVKYFHGDEIKERINKQVRSR